MKFAACAAARADRAQISRGQRRSFARFDVEAPSQPVLGEASKS